MATVGCGSDQAEWIQYLTDLNSTPEARRIYLGSSFTLKDD